jgi:hypothetical protein
MKTTTTHEFADHEMTTNQRRGCLAERICLLANNLNHNAQNPSGPNMGDHEALIALLKRAIARLEDLEAIEREAATRAAADAELSQGPSKWSSGRKY